MGKPAENQQPALLKYRDCFYVTLLTLLAVAMMFTLLGARGLVGDEAIYAHVIDRIVETGNWLHVRITPCSGAFDKPPLYFWLTCTTAGLFDDCHVGYRFWSALLGCGCIILTYGLGRLLFNAEVGLLSGLILVGNKYFVFYHGARDACLDCPLAFFALVSFTIYWRMREKSTAWLLLGLAAAASCMLKQLVGLPVLAVLACHHWCCDREHTLKRRLAGPVLAGLTCLAALIPWHYFQWVEFGNDFFSFFYIHNVLERAATGLTPEHIQGPWFYWLSISRSSPFFFLFIPALATSGIAVYRGLFREPLLFLMFGILGMIGIMSLSKSKLAWYVYSAYPLIAILLAAVLVGVARITAQRLKEYGYRRFSFAALYGLIILLGITQCAYSLARRIPRQREAGYAPLQVYRRLESHIQAGKARLVCYRFASPDRKPELEHFSIADVWYVKRMPQAVWIDDPVELFQFLEDGLPTYVLMGANTDVRELMTAPFAEGSIRISPIGKRGFRLAQCQ